MRTGSTAHVDSCFRNLEKQALPHKETSGEQRTTAIEKKRMEAIGPHSFWGFSPSIDLFQIQHEAHNEEQKKPGALECAASEEDPLVALLGEVGDPRHILRTIAARRSHSYKPIHVRASLCFVDRAWLRVEPPAR